MSDALADPAVLVDHVLKTCGGGLVAVVGPGAAPLIKAFRNRAVPACEVAAGTWSQAAAGLAAHPDGSIDLVILDGLPGDEAAADLDRAFDRALGVSRGNVLLRVAGRRDAWEKRLLAHDCRKHPLHQLLVPYQGLDWEKGPTTLLMERLPASVAVGRLVTDLLPARDLHMDMLREAGRRADAHVARYMFARQFIRPGDRVLDAACGLGYGSAILADGTLAESVEGVDIDAGATDYATAHYAGQRRRVSFTTCDLSALASRPAGCLDAIVSFETLEHIADPDRFLATCRRLLTPGGRLVCSVPNEWLNEDGVDPNPYHLQVFDRDRLERDCGRHFLVEHTYGQTAGGGMKLTDAPRRLWRAEAGEQDAEWWLLVGMTDPIQQNAGPVRHGLTTRPVDERTNLLAFDRDYTDPWLVKAMVTMGLRTESPLLLSALANWTLATASEPTADAGAALCVRAYRLLEQGDAIPEALFTAISGYCDGPAHSPHARRWQISLRYVEALARMSQGQVAAAAIALESCASSDALEFNPLLATKTVGAAFLRGWLALQARDLGEARRWWLHGVGAAEAAIGQRWDDVLLDRERPALFALREATAVMDLASQCASGLALLDHAIDRPGVVAAQLFESLQHRLDRATRAAAPPASAAEPVEASAALAAPVAVTDAAATEPAACEPPRWELMAHLNECRLTSGEPNQLSAWDAVIEDEYSRNVYLHPPAILEATIPDGSAGRLSARVALHPEAWGREGASACHFTVTVDSVAEASVLVDPHQCASHRRWFEVVLSVPASDTGTHTLTLETRSAGAPHFGWALFRDVSFTGTAGESAVDRTAGLGDSQAA